MAAAALVSTLLLLVCYTSASPLLAKVEPGGKLLAIPIGSAAQNHSFQLDLDADVSLLHCPPKSTPIPCSNPILCPSKQCSASKQCLQSISKKSTVPLVQQAVSLFTTDAASSNPAALVAVQGITFGCLKNSKGVEVAALSKSSLSLPLQLASVNRKGTPNKFTLCLSPSSTSQIYFGDDSSIVLGGINFSTSFSSVAFVPNPFHPTHYYLPLQTIRIQDVSGSEIGAAPASAFAIDSNTGIGGIKFSSRDKYTKLARPAYVAVRDAFKKYASGLRIPMVPPPAGVGLELCFNASFINGNRLGPVVPTVEMGMGSEAWTLAGFSVVEFVNGSACLAFVDAGPLPVTSSIGLYQQYDNLLRFDAAASRFGYIDRGLHLYRMSCKV